MHPSGEIDAAETDKPTVMTETKASAMADLALHDLAGLTTQTGQSTSPGSRASNTSAICAADAADTVVS